MRATYSLPSDLVEEVKRLAKLYSTSQSSIVATALGVYLTIKKVSPGGAQDLNNIVKHNQLELFRKLKD